MTEEEAKKMLQGLKDFMTNTNSMLETLMNRTNNLKIDIRSPS